MQPSIPFAPYAMLKLIFFLSFVLAFVVFIVVPYIQAYQRRKALERRKQNERTLPSNNNNKDF